MNRWIKYHLWQLYFTLKFNSLICLFVVFFLHMHNSCAFFRNWHIVFNYNNALISSICPFCVGGTVLVCLKALICLWQAKASLEKSKQQLETQNTEREAELQQVSAARQEADRKRKQAEQQLQEVSVRLADVDKTRGDLGDKAAKCQVPCFSLNTSYLVSCDAVNSKLILLLFSSLSSL